MANDVIINVKSNTKGAQQGLSNMQGSLKKLGDGARKAGLALAAVGGVGAVAIKGFVSAALEQQRSTQLLASSIENLGISYDSVRHDIEKTTSALQAKTNFGDEEQMRALALMVPMLGSVDKAMAALPAVMDAASVKGVSLSTVAGTLTRALSGQVNTAITLGMAFDESADFGERLEQVLTAIAGAAEANADPLTQLGNDIGDLKEKIGFALLPVIDPLVQKMRAWAVEMQGVDEQTLQTIAKVALFGTAFALAGGVILGLVALIPSVVGGFTLIAGAVAAVGLPIIAIGAAIAGLAFAWKFNWFNIRDKTEFVVDQLGISFEDLLKWIGVGGRLETALKNMRDNWEISWHGLGGRGQSFVEKFMNMRVPGFGSASDLKPVIDKVEKFAEGFANAGKEIVRTDQAGRSMGIHLTAVLDGVADAAERARGAIASMFAEGTAQNKPSTMFGGEGMVWNPQTEMFVPRAQATPDFSVFQGGPEAVAGNIAAQNARRQEVMENRNMAWVEGNYQIASITMDGKPTGDIIQGHLGAELIYSADVRPD